MSWRRRSSSSGPGRFAARKLAFAFSRSVAAMILARELGLAGFELRSQSDLAGAHQRGLLFHDAKQRLQRVAEMRDQLFGLRQGGDRAAQRCGVRGQFVHGFAIAGVVPDFASCCASKVR